MTTRQLCQGPWLRQFTGSISRLLLSMNYSRIQVIIMQVYSSRLKKKKKIRTPFCVNIPVPTMQNPSLPSLLPICYCCSLSPSLRLLHDHSLTCSSFPCLHPASSHYLTTSESPANRTNCLKTHTHAQSGRTHPDTSSSKDEPLVPNWTFSVPHSCPEKSFALLN